jgi:hypothetical protein
MQGTKEVRNGTIWGILLIIAGVVFLLQNMGIFVNIGELMGMGLFAAGGLLFLYLFLTDLPGRWWAAIPGATLLGLAGTIFFDNYAPRFLDGLGGPLFLASIGFGFVLVYLADLTKWWAIIPAGVLSTLAVVAGFDELNLRGIDTGSLFFLGLGGTFLLLALLTGQRGERQTWAFIPAAVLLVMGVLIGTPRLGRIWFGYLDNLWPVALIVIGLFWVLRNLTHRDREILSDASLDEANQTTTQLDDRS